MRGVALAVSGLVLLVAAPAGAHPFGPPPTARVAAQGQRLVVDWRAAPDDAVAIGERLGVMPAGSVAAYREESAAQVAPSTADEARLSASPQLRDYLTRRITATQEGRQCRSEVAPVDDFVHRGARVVITCPQRITSLMLRIAMLHDIHDAYRTVAVGGSEDAGRAVFTVHAAEQRWPFAAPAGDRSRAVAVAVAVAAAAFLVLAVRRRR